MLSAQQNNPPANPQGVITSNTGSPSKYAELSNQFVGLSINPTEQQENPGLTKQSGAAFSPNSSQTFPSGQPMKFMVYRDLMGNMVMSPVANQSQVNPSYVYPSQTPHTYTQHAYNPPVYNQVYPQQHFNQGYPTGEQALVAQGGSSHASQAPSQNAPPLNTNPGFIQRVQTLPVTVSRSQMPNPVLNPGMTHTRVMNPYGVRGQPVVQLPMGQQPVFGFTQVPYPPGQNRPNMQQPIRYKPYQDKGSSKINDIYCPESSNPRRPSPSDSPRGQNRRSSGGSSKGHGKSDSSR